MSVAASRSAPLRLSVWDEWVAETGTPILDAAGWALRTLTQALAVALAWPLRLACSALRQVHWGSGETLISAVVLGCPTLLLLRLLPRVTWPTAAQAVTDLQRAGWVLHEAGHLVIGPEIERTARKIYSKGWAR